MFAAQAIRTPISVPGGGPGYPFSNPHSMSGLVSYSFIFMSYFQLFFRKKMLFELLIINTTMTATLNNNNIDSNCQ